MKIALSPDLHCFYNTYDKLDDNGNSRRKKEWEDATQYMLNQCEANGVDAVIFPGDFFVTPKPSAERVLMVSSLFRSFEERKIKVVGTVGNHDIAGVNSTSMDNVVSAIGNKDQWCVSDFDVYRIRNVGFAFLPFVKSAKIEAYNPDFANMEMSEQLTHIAGALYAKLKEDPKVKKTILVGHWSLQGSVTSSGRSMERKQDSKEVVLPLADIASQGWDALLFGHIHKPQVLNDSKPFAAYSGCVQRINIGEANDKRGFFIYDTETDKHEFIEFPVFEMKSFSAEIKTQADVDNLLNEIESSDIEDKIVQVKYTISKNDIDMVDKKTVIEALRNKKPMYIVGIFPSILEVERQRDMSITETLDARSAFEKWMQVKAIPDEQRPELLNMFDEYRRRVLEME